MSAPQDGITSAATPSLFLVFWYFVHCIRLRKKLTLSIANDCLLFSCYKQDTSRQQKLASHVSNNDGTASPTFTPFP